MGHPERRAPAKENRQQQNAGILRFAQDDGVAKEMARMATSKEIAQDDGVEGDRAGHG